MFIRGSELTIWPVRDKTRVRCFLRPAQTWQRGSGGGAQRSRPWGCGCSQGLGLCLEAASFVCPVIRAEARGRSQPDHQMVASERFQRLTEGTRVKWGDVRVPAGYSAALQLGTEAGGGIRDSSHLSPHVNKAP